MEALAAKQHTNPWQQQVERNLQRCDDLDRTDRDIILACCQFQTIGTLDENNLKQSVKALLIKLSIMYGVAAPTEEVELIVMINTLKEIYPSTTVEEISKAASLNMAGLFNPKVQCYGMVSLDFISNLMVQFRHHRSQAHKRLNHFTQSQKTDVQDSSKPGYRNEDYFHRFIQWTNENKRFPDHWNWRSVYKYIEFKNWFHDTLQEREEMRKKIESGTKAELRKKKILSDDSVQAMQLGQMIDGNYATNDFYHQYVKEWAIQSGMIDKSITL